MNNLIQKSINDIILAVITDISKDYNIDIDELSNKYINKADEVNEKKKIKKVSPNDKKSDELKKIENVKVSKKSNEIINEPLKIEDIDESLDLYKVITLKGVEYLLNQKTNEVLDMEYKIIGEKREKKYYLNKKSLI